MKPLKVSLLLLLALLVMALSAGLWILHSQSGARWAFERATALSPQPLVVEDIDGTIAGTLVLQGVHYGDADAGVILNAERVRLQLAPLDLLNGTIHIEDALLEGVRLNLLQRSQQTKQQPQEQQQPFDVRPPIDIVVDNLQLRDGTLSRNGEPLVQVRTLQLDGRWTRDGIFLDTLDLQARQGQLSLAGVLKRDDIYVLETEGTFQWSASGRTFAGTVSSDTEDGAIDMQVALSEPADARMSVVVDQRPRLHWTFALDVPQMSASELLPGTTIDALSATLEGRGDRSAGTVHGQIVIDDTPLQLDPWTFTLAGQHLQVDAITRVGTDAGKVRINGDIALGRAPRDAEFQAFWSDVELPAEWLGQRLETNGQLTLAADAREYSAEGTLAIGPPGQLADIALDARGSREQINIERLTVRQPSGNLTAQGTITLQPALSWDLEASANDFNPGALFAQWPGSLSFGLDTHGRLSTGLPQGELHIENLRGRLRDRRLSGSADLALAAQGVPSGELRLRSGDSYVVLRADPGAHWDVTGRFAVVSLDTWTSQATGSVRGRFSLEGSWPELNVTASASARDVEVGAIKIASAQANVAGSRADHRVEIDVDGEPASVSLVATGTREPDNESNDGERWRETIQQLTLTLPPIEPLSLRQPARLLVDDGNVELEQTCLANDRTTLCTAGRTTNTGAFSAQYRLDGLPLALLAAFSPATVPLDISGSIDGEGEIRRDAEGRLYGRAVLRSATGQLANHSDGDRRSQELFSYQDLLARVQLDNTEAHASLNATLDEDGYLKGEAYVSGLGTATRPIRGDVTAYIADLSPLSLLSLHVANVDGSVRLQADIDGTLTDPRIVPRLRATELALDLPALGIELRNGTLRAQRGGEKFATVSGQIESGKGELTLSGRIYYDGDLRLQLEGQRFTVADLPGAHVIASPDLQLRREDGRLRLTGELLLPSATINVQDLPRMVRAQTGSSDVVIVGARTQQKRDRQEAGELPLYADVDVTLGEDVTLSGFGLQANVSGQVSVDEAPGEPTTGSGELRVSGTYKAYGQDLTITQGSLIYADTPLDDPSLRVVAVRELEGAAKAGLRIAGTAQDPQLTVFSDPAMDDANALSYLVAGRSVDDIGEQDSDALQSAARSLGTAAGSLISKGIGGKLGLDTVGVEHSEALDGAAFTVGEYLSPRLYLSYGVGLFEPGDVVSLRYRLSDELALRALRGPNETRAGIEYRVEK